MERKYFEQLRFVEKTAGVYVVKKPVLDIHGNWTGEWFAQGRAYQQKGIYDLVNHEDGLAFILTSEVFEDLTDVRRKRQERREKSNTNKTT